MKRLAPLWERGDMPRDSPEAAEGARLLFLAHAPNPAPGETGLARRGTGNLKHR